MRSTEVSPAELEEIAANSGASIELPGNRAGWARVTANGRRYHAFVLAPEAVVS